jgi:hypothetical protein
MDAGIYKVNLCNNGVVEKDRGWISSLDGEIIEIQHGQELEIRGVEKCEKANYQASGKWVNCVAGKWCPGRFIVTKPFKGSFCLVLYCKPNVKGQLGISLVRNLKWKDGRLLRRISLDLSQTQNCL